MKNKLPNSTILALFIFKLFFSCLMTSTTANDQCGMEEAMKDLRKSRSFFSGKPWPNGQIPFEIHSSLRPTDLKALYSAISDFHQYTCVKFTPKTNDDKSYVTVRVNFKARKCGSAVFCYIEGQKSHFAEVASWCPYKWTWAHELSHSLCLGHEQGRVDRNEFLSFEECNDTSLITPIVKKQNLHGQIYDYNSVMHSSCYGGCWGRPKINAHYVKRCGPEVAGQDTAGLSLLDIEKINEYYNCFDGCKRHRWYNVKNLTEGHMQSVVNFGIREGDIEPLYMCRGYSAGDIAVGWYRPDEKICQISAQGYTFNVTEHIQVFALPNGSNKVTKDSKPYRLYTNSGDSLNLGKYLAVGRTVENMPIFAAIVEIVERDGRAKTAIGKVNSNYLSFAYVPGYENLGIQVFRRFLVLGCSETGEIE